MASENHAALSSTTLFARNLPFTLDDKTLEKVFSEVGPVKRCFVVKDKGKNCKWGINTMILIHHDYQ